MPDTWMNEVMMKLGNSYDILRHDRHLTTRPVPTKSN